MKKYTIQEVLNSPIGSEFIAEDSGEKFIVYELPAPLQTGNIRKYISSQGKDDYAIASDGLINATFTKVAKPQTFAQILQATKKNPDLLVRVTHPYINTLSKKEVVLFTEPKPIGVVMRHIQSVIKDSIMPVLYLEGIWFIEE